MPPVRRTASGDARAAKAQLKTADQTARVAKASRPKDDDTLTLPLRDQEYQLGQVPSLMALMEWGAATGGESLVAAFNVLKALVHEDDFADFKKFCREEDVEADELGDFINAAMEALAGRPTVGSAGSSGG